MLPRDRSRQGPSEHGGCRNWSTDRLRQAIGIAVTSPPVATSSQYSLVDQLAEPWQGVTTLTGAERAGEREWLAETGIAVLAWSPLAGGYLTTVHEPGSTEDQATTPLL